MFGYQRLNQPRPFSQNPGWEFHIAVHPTQDNLAKAQAVLNRHRNLHAEIKANGLLGKEIRVYIHQKDDKKNYEYTPTKAKALLLSLYSDLYKAGVTGLSYTPSLVAGDAPLPTSDVHLPSFFTYASFGEQKEDDFIKSFTVTRDDLLDQHIPLPFVDGLPNDQYVFLKQQLADKAEDFKKETDELIAQTSKESTSKESTSDAGSLNIKDDTQRIVEMWAKHGPFREACGFKNDDDMVKIAKHSPQALRRLSKKYAELKNLEIRIADLEKRLEHREQSSLVNNIFARWYWNRNVHWSSRNAPQSVRTMRTTLQDCLSKASDIPIITPIFASASNGLRANNHTCCLFKGPQDPMTTALCEAINDLQIRET